MRSLYRDADRRDILRRAGQLTPEHRPAWGRMNARQMLAHVSEALRMGLGDVVIPQYRHIVRFSPLKELIIYWLPFPKGAPTAPQLLARSAEDWDAEQQVFRTLVERFNGSIPTGATPVHPLFGRMTWPQWGVLTYRHLDHHLRQFGV
jgi:hypothetical protein